MAVQKKKKKIAIGQDRMRGKRIESNPRPRVHRYTIGRVGGEGIKNANANKINSIA